jgi:hypothetical protein
MDIIMLCGRVIVGRLQWPLYITVEGIYEQSIIALEEAQAIHLKDLANDFIQPPALLSMEIQMHAEAAECLYADAPAFQLDKGKDIIQVQIMMHLRSTATPFYRS